MCIWRKKERELLGYNRFQKKMSEKTIQFLNDVLEK